MVIIRKTSNICTVYGNNKIQIGNKGSAANAYLTKLLTK